MTVYVVVWVASDYDEYADDLFGDKYTDGIFGVFATAALADTKRSDLAVKHDGHRFEVRTHELVS
jgi:hypothetical protein